MKVEILDKESFNSFITQKGLVVVDFYASWCGPCKMMAPELEDFAMEDGEVKVGKIDVDNANELARDFNIMSVPTLIYFKDGQLIDKSIGYLTKDEMSEIVAKYK